MRSAVRTPSQLEDRGVGQVRDDSRSAQIGCGCIVNRDFGE